MNMKKLGLKLIAAAMTAMIALQPSVYQIGVAASDEGRYMSEVVVSYGKTDAEAKQWLTDKGYNIVDQNLNEGAEGGADWLSWAGMASEKRSVYLGYKTTNDASEAITDMRIMNMNGGYGFQAYEKLLNDRKAEITEIVNDTVFALKEYRTNYKKGVTKAVIAHDTLNLLSDDDSGDALLGDLLLNPIRQEITEEAYEAAPEEHLDFVTLMMQGNSASTELIMTTLALAADTASDSWLDRACKVDDGYMGLLHQYEEKLPSKSMEELDNMLTRAYDDNAKTIARSIESLRSKLRIYTISGVKKDSPAEEVEKYVCSLSESDRAAWESAAMLWLTLDDKEYDGGTLAEFLMDEDKDFVNDLEARQELYPFVDAMSEGQRAMLNYNSFESMVNLGMLTAKGWTDYQQMMQEQMANRPVMSAYFGVDRSVFNPDGIALTNEAIRVASSDQLKREESPIETVIAVWFVSAMVDLLLVGFGVISFREINTEDVDLFTESIKLATARKEKLTPALNKASQIKTDASNLLKGDLLDEYNQLKDGEKINWLIKNTEDLPDELGEKVDDLDRALKDLDEIQGDIDDYKARINSTSSTNRIAACVGTVLCIAAFMMVAFATYMTFREYYYYYHVDMKPIPRVIVSQTDTDDGYELTNYYAVKCNRNDQGMGSENLNDYADLNGDVMRQWLGLYTTKDPTAGKPILAGFKVEKGSANVPAGTEPLAMFGGSSAVNMVDEAYVYNNTIGGLYLYYQVDNGAVVAGTVTSYGTLAITSVLSAIAGAGIFAAISSLRKRRKTAAAV